MSPFGRLEGRDEYLNAVELLARKSFMQLMIRDVISTGGQAAAWFENQTPNGLSPDEQEKLYEREGGADE